jgi:hypothetical protein
MKTLRNLEGELMIDHRASPGMPADLVALSGLPPEAGQGLFEGATYTCGHCQAIVVMNPSRTRERTVCRGCMHVICDACSVVKGQTLTCRPFQQVVDEALTAAEAALALKEI